MKVRVTLPGKEPRPAEMLVEGGENRKRAVEKGSHKCELRSHYQLQKWGLYLRQVFLLHFVKNVVAYTLFSFLNFFIM